MKPALPMLAILLLLPFGAVAQEAAPSAPTQAAPQEQDTMPKPGARKFFSLAGVRRYDGTPKPYHPGAYAPVRGVVQHSAAFQRPPVALGKVPSNPVPSSPATPPATPPASAPASTPETASKEAKILSVFGP